MYKNAAEGGHLHILKYGLERGFPGLDDFDVYAAAAAGGHVRVLEWLFRYEPFVRMTVYACVSACMYVFLKCRWLHLMSNPV